jgi:hypothetical protein
MFFKRLSGGQKTPHPICHQCCKLNLALVLLTCILDVSIQMLSMLVNIYHTTQGHVPQDGNPTVQKTLCLRYKYLSVSVG